MVATKLMNLDVESNALKALHRRIKVNMTSFMVNMNFGCVFYLFVTVVDHWGFWEGLF